MLGGQTKERLDTLKLEYERVVRERERLRDARAFFARQLGPLPTFAGVSLGVVGAFAVDEADQEEWVIVALALSLVLILSSTYFSSRRPYRKLRTETARCLRRDPGEIFEFSATTGTDPRTPTEWYERELRLERALYSRLGAEMDRERLGLYLTQVLFLAVIACLILAFW